MLSVKRAATTSPWMSGCHCAWLAMKVPMKITSKTTALDLLLASLKQHGCAGLYNRDLECSCTVADFAPCGCDPFECQPGFQRPCEPATCVYGGGCVCHIEGPTP